MKRIICVEREPGIYDLADINDERLFCIGQILINDHLRTALKNVLEETVDLGLERHHEFETELFSLRLSPSTKTILLLQLTEKKEPYQVYETDIALETLLDLIDEWEDAADGEADIIVITRQQDVFDLEAQYTA